MVQTIIKTVKDLGLQKEVYEALPYQVVRGTWEGSLSSPLPLNASYKTLLNHIVPAGKQLKILFLRVWTEEQTGAKFSIVQSNPAAAGATGTVEAYPVVGSAPAGTIDYPFLAAPGDEVLHGSLPQPVHVCEGSITFNLIGATPSPATGAKYSLSWWGVQKVPEDENQA